MKTYKGDPYWTVARFNSKCYRCKQAVTRGDDIFYYPRTKTVYGGMFGCGSDASNEYQAAAMDEAFCCGDYYD